MAAAKELGMDVALATVLSEPGDIFPFKKIIKAPLKAFLAGQHWLWQYATPC